jgi:hypothetical protein
MKKGGNNLDVVLGYCQERQRPGVPLEEHWQSCILTEWDRSRACRDWGLDGTLSHDGIIALGTKLCV